MKFVVSKNEDKKEFYKVGNILLDEFFKSENIIYIEKDSEGKISECPFYDIG